MPIGSGPFRVVEHALGKYLRLERNPDYFNNSPKPRPKIDKVEIRFVPDAQTRVAEVVAGGLDLIMYVARDQAEQLRAVPSLQIVPSGTMRYSYLSMNTMTGTPAPQLRDIRVRRAIMHAIDRETIATQLLGESARVLHVECVPSDFGCMDADVPRYDYDPDKARQLLAESGYAGGFDLDIYASRDRNQTEAIIGYLNAVGIRARLRFVQVGAMTAARRGGRLAISDSYWGGGGMSDVSVSTSPFHQFSFDDMNRDPEVRDLLRRGDTSMDPDVRKSAYAQALKLIAERAYVLPLYSLSNYHVAARGLVFKPYPDNTLRFWEMSYR
jgi:peptide/nickel transport system substrate-binding protein